MQAPGKPEQYFAPTGSAPARIAVLGVGALGEDAVAVALAHQSAHAGRLADPGYEAHGNHCPSARARTMAGILCGPRPGRPVIAEKAWMGWVRTGDTRP
jgi:hypothetical protein